jgi:hypothetical protein
LILNSKFLKDTFLKEIKPSFEKFLTYFDEYFNSFEIIHTTLSQPSSNIEAPIIRESLLLTSTCYTNFFKANNRHKQFVSEIAKLIGTSNKLYQFTINHLSTLYLNTHNCFYSTLRSQLLIQLNSMHNHDTLNSIVTNGHGDIQGENLLKFATLINSCLKEKKIETKRAKELETIMEWKKFDKILP